MCCPLQEACLALTCLQALRSFFPLVQGALGELRFLDKAVSLVLGFIGSKMIADFAGYHISTNASLAVVATALAGGVGASLLFPEPGDEEEE
jgi:predicted tellurium resistance membrane protein TerC